ncbi:MAG: hypothetical protein R2783_01270 [Gelidibacter sp.]
MKKGYDCDSDVNCIKLKLFEAVDDYLEELFVKGPTIKKQSAPIQKFEGGRIASIGIVYHLMQTKIT